MVTEMEFSKSNKCDPCYCHSKSPSPQKTHYFYSLQLPNKELNTANNETKPQRPKSRPSSASSVKSSNSNKKSFSSSKNASSDSKISKKSVLTKTKITPKERKSKMEPAQVEQLKKDLKTIKDQLFLLTQNKSECLNVTNELEERFKKLKDTSLNQEKQIEQLQFENQQLRAKLNHQSNITNPNNVTTTKLALDDYEKHLSTLYNELLETSKVMQESRNKVCQCIKEKSYEYHEMANSKKELSKVVENSEAKYANLLLSYQKAKENEQKYIQQNQILNRNIKKIEDQLNQTKIELDRSRQEATNKVREVQAELNKTNQYYAKELQSKAEALNELNSTLNQVQSQLRKCTKTATDNSNLNNNYEELLQKYQLLLEKLKMAEETNQKSVEEIETMRKHEKCLCSDIAKLKNYVEELTNCNNQNNLAIAELTCVNQEKESMIMCQKTELASKNKQIDLLIKNEERLKKRVVQLQEDIVSIKINSSPAQQRNATILCAEDCSIHLTEELQDLITALYKEIDKTLAKDEEIQRLNRNLCCLQCALSAKERELISVRNELKILRNQFTTTLKEKKALTDHLKEIQAEEMESEDATSEDNNNYCYCEISEY